MERLINLNMQNNVLTKNIKVVQNDTGRNLKVTLGDADVSEFTTARIYAKKPDDTEVYNDCTISQGYILVPLSSQTLAVVGEVSCELQCNGTSGYVTSYPFKLEVIKSLVSDSSIESSNQYTALEILLNAANAAVVTSTSQMTDTTKTYYLTTTGLVYRYNTTTSAWEAISFDPTTVYTKTETDDLLEDKVDKVTGKGLSTNDYDDTEKANVASNTSARHTHENKALLDTYTQTESDIADAVAKKHTHSNKDLLDAYTHSNSDITEAISDIATIEGKIPDQASTSNQLADKAFVNSSISTETAHYISDNGEPFTSVAALEAYTGTVTNNDYAFVTGTDSVGNTYFDRYKATVSGSTVTWAKEYRLNNSSFTAVQWAAITSGLSSTDKTKLDGIEAGANNYTLPTASDQTKGGIKIGERVSIDSDGFLSADNMKLVEGYFYNGSFYQDQQHTIYIDPVKDIMYADLENASLIHIYFWDGNSFVNTTTEISLDIFTGSADFSQYDTWTDVTTYTTEADVIYCINNNRNIIFAVRDTSTGVYVWLRLNMYKIEDSHLTYGEFSATYLNDIYNVSYSYTAEVFKAVKTKTSDISSTQTQITEVD